MRHKADFLQANEQMSKCSLLYILTLWIAPFTSFLFSFGFGSAYASPWSLPLYITIYRQGRPQPLDACLKHFSLPQRKIKSRKKLIITIIYQVVFSEQEREREPPLLILLAITLENQEYFQE